MNKNVLIEIGMEELPTAAVSDLAEAGSQLWQKVLAEQSLAHEGIVSFASPRRLAWRIKGLAMQQADRKIERKGPMLAAAKDKDGNWSKAALGFAASCGVAVEDLAQAEADKGAALMFYGEEKGRAFKDLLPELFAEVIKQLPIAKRMRWGDFEQAFVRPVNTLIALADDEILPLAFFGVQADNYSQGHRVHHSQAVRITHADDYEAALESAYVIADIEKRKALIGEQVQAATAALGGKALMPEDLVHEVASLTEWPVAIAGHFEEKFLAVPQEVLITTMQDNQKTFAVLDKDGKMLPHFIAVANLESKDPVSVSKGNEKVIRPRFADAEFFWQQDLKRRLADYLPRLEKVVYQEKLGSLAEKSRRVQELVKRLAPLVQADAAATAEAARLCKCDLQSEMVMEFPELQGVMGKYYARREGLAEEVAQALEEQYFPLGAGGDLPATGVGTALAIAEKVDTLIGGFAIGAKPTGSKDPYALRRMAIGIIRLLVEKGISLPLQELFAWSAASFTAALQAEKVLPEVRDYVLERLQGYYRDQGIAIESYQAVRALDGDDLLDFDRRIHALHAFAGSANALSLLASAKRIRNILKKNGENTQAVAENLLQEAAEKALWQAWLGISGKVQAAVAAKDYFVALQALGELAAPLEAFFADVMVMADDAALRANRLALLTTMQQGFAQIADLSLLQG